jgi:putative ABC transport system ATP-binding protein
MLSMKNLNICFGTNLVLKNASVQIQSSDHLQILGASGTGKSSLLKSLIQFIPTPTAEIHLNNRNLTPSWIDEYRLHFAYIGQKPPYYTSTVSDFLYQPFHFKQNKLQPRPDSKEITTLLSSLGFTNLPLTQPYNSLSGGEQQRINIAQALLLKREIYLLDEITSALDPTNTERVISIFSEMKETTLVIVSHDLEWQQTSTRQIFIKNQQLIEVGS